MKELSIEEKAKRYDKAIETARKINSGEGVVSPPDWTICEVIFPELKESEDEKIRKALIHFIKQGEIKGTIRTYLGVTEKEMIAWLEKQGQKPVWSEEDKNMLEWVIGYLDNRVLNTPISEERIACKNAIAWFKKLEGEQKPNPCDGCVNRKGCINCENGELRETEQKPADKVEPKFKVGDKIYLKPEYRMPDDDTPIANTVFEIRAIDDKHYRFDGSYIFIEDQNKYELVEQKSAWSEEDEAHLIILDSICESSEAEYYDHPESLGKKAIINAKNWLKTLKNRIQSQNRWKPSDEQMNLLEELVEDNNQRYFYTILRSLYEQLKKLKG